MLNEHTRDLINDVEVVSFDVFDTLLLRCHYSPTDVFAEAADPHGPRSFRLRRIAAERIARFIHRHQEDVSLDQIYRFLGAAPEREIYAERKSLFSNPEVQAIYRYALDRGKRVIAISDMYLPEPVIREALAGAGYTAISKVYVSNVVGLTKGGGRLFRHVIRDLGLDAHRILHVGDNAVSDYVLPRREGLRALHIPSTRARFEAGIPMHPGLVRALQHSRRPLHSLLLGLMRDALADHRPESDYWYVIGFSVVGPVVNAFVDWIKEQVNEGGHDKVFFLARDGHLPRKIFSLKYPGTSSEYTFASRRLFLVPALEHLDEITIEGLCSALPGTPSWEYWERLGIDNPAVEKLLGAHFPNNPRIWSPADRRRLAAFFTEAHSLFQEDAIHEKERLRDYLSSIGMLKNGSRPLIVDVGWRASSQCYLEKAFPELKGTHGAYFGLTTEAYRNGRMKGFFFDGNTPARMHHLTMHCVEIIELMFSAPHPSVHTIESAADGSYTPRYEASTTEEEQRISIVERLHQGAMDFTHRLMELETRGYPIRIGREDAALCIEPLMLHPTPVDIAQFGSLPHALGLGESRYETLLPDDLPKSPLRLLGQYLGKPRKRLYWPRGITRAILFRHGHIYGFGARCAITVYCLVLIGRGILYRALGK